MRYFWILLCLVCLAVLAWFATMRGTDGTAMRGAPQIETLVDQGVTGAIGPVAGPGVTVETDGRNVTLKGEVYSTAERDAVLEAAGGVRLLGRLTDALEVLPEVTPFTFTAEKSADGAMVLGGHIPTLAIEEEVLAQAKALVGTAPLKTQLKRAAGVPEGDWSGMVRQGLVAIAQLETGALTITGAEARVSGQTPSQEAATAALAATQAAPMGNWTLDIQGVLPVADPYVLSAFKTPDGAVILDGHAPDEAARAAIVAAAEAAGTQPVSDGLELARGAPDGDWGALVGQALAALGVAETGLLNVSGTAVALEADVDTIEDGAALEALASTGWDLKITVLNPPPPADVTLAVGEDGTVAASGRLPEGLSAQAFAAALPGTDVTGLSAEEPGVAVDWTSALQGLEIVLPRFQTASVHLLGQTLTIRGTLRRGFSEDGSEAALRAVLDRDWALDLDITEPAPLSEVILSKRGDEIALSGVLPMGLDPDAALETLGDMAGGEGLTGGGAGDPEAWRTALAGVSGTLALFTDATGTMAEGRIDLTGTLKPGYPLDTAQGWLDDQLPEGWAAGLSGEETAANEGDARRNLTSGETERFRLGYWLPEVTFPVSLARCTVEADAALEREKIQFITGSAEIDRKGRALLNRLSAVAIRCLNSSELSLEIGGHTDSVGNDAANQSLSEQRAQAVLQALIARGVKAEALTAVGYGESQPVASNDSPEGRAQNRRITFGWVTAAQ